MKGLSTIVWLLVMAVSAQAGIPENWQNKVEARLLQSSATTNEFIVIMAEQSDLSGAANLKTKEAKGRYVFERLMETARRTQAPVLEKLRAQNLDCQPFWVANAIRVRGDSQVIQSLAQATHTARIVANAVTSAPAT